MAEPKPRCPDCRAARILGRLCDRVLAAMLTNDQEAKHRQELRECRVFAWLKIHRPDFRID